ncbi:MAG TPA: GntR family transcriptional regulator [Capsulimonadaceae bacterium]|jgi:LacI family transcriptional regulator
MPKIKTTAKRLAFSVPAYKRIEDDLRSRIRVGDWRSGHRIPGRRELAKAYNVELNTLQRAILNLIEDGTLRAESGRGTYVAGDTLNAARESIATAPEPPIFTKAEVAVATRVVGVIGSFDTRDDSGKWANTWNGTILRYMEQVFSGANVLPHYSDMIYSGIQVRTLLETIDLLRSKGAEAIAVAGFTSTDTGQAAWDASAAFPDLPMVFVSTSAPIRYPINHVYYDSATAGYQAGLHLVQQGCREIMFFSPFDVEWAELRCSGASDAAIRAGGWCVFTRTVTAREFTSLPSNAAIRGDLRVHEQLAYEDACAYLAKNPCPSGVVAANDWVAFGFMTAAAERGFVAGRDYAIIGFDDHARARAEGLSSMAPPLETLGREAARMLLAAMTDRLATGSLCLHSRLMQRKSSLIG